MVCSRRFLVYACVFLLSSISVLTPVGGQSDDGSAPAFFYRVSNGNTTTVLEALVDGQTAVEFYGYSSGDSSSHTGYEESETLSIFLWSGPEGKSLVFMADEANDGTGGKLTVVVDGLAAGAGWSVKDDPGDGYTQNSATWNWIYCCTDGGVMDLATSDAIALSLTFPTVSGLDTFRLFGGPASDPQFVTFDPTQPLIIETFQTPGAPGLAATAGPGVGEVSLEATPPADDGGDPVTAYHFYANGAWLGASDTPSFLATGLGEGATYTFTARAANLGGLGNVSDPVQATTYGRPGIPLDVVVQAAGAGELTVTWEPPVIDGGTPITAYRVERDGVDLGDRTSGFVDAGLDAGTSYTYTVYARNLVGEGPGATGTGTTHGVPGVPVDMGVATPPLAGTLDVNWTPPVDDGGLPVTGYHVYRDGQPLAVVANATTFRDTGLVDGTTYTYAVAAITDVGEGPAKAANGTTADAPDAPQDVRVEGREVGAIDIEWSPVTDDNGAPVTHYTIYAGDAPDDLQPIGQTNETYFRDHNDVPLPQARYYAVTASNVVGESAFSMSGCGVWGPFGATTGLICG